MRYIVLTMIFVAVFAFSAAAQVHFGVKAGANMAKLTGDGWDVAEAELETQIDNKFKMGFAFGVAAEMPLGQSGLALQPEVLYVMKGAKAEFPEMVAEGYDITMEIKQDYIEVPVLIKYNVPTQGNLTPNFFAGPVAAFNVASKMEWDNLPAELSGEVEEGDIENVASVDFGVTFGGGIGLATSSGGKFILDVRYTLGLAETFDDVAAEDYEEGKLYFTGEDDSGMEFKNNDIRVMIGFLF